MIRRKALLSLLCAGFALAGCRAPPKELPSGYPASYGKVIEAARAEGDLLIWSAIDQGKAAALVNGFRHHYPFIRVHYVELSAGDVYRRVVTNAARGAPVADFLWSSAMDLQIKLANDGYAQTYRSPEAENLPDWANWKDEAWGTTAEPVVMLYNRRLIDDSAVPRDHIALTQLLEQHPRFLKGSVATYDVPHSAVGYLYLSQDQQATHDIWRLVAAMGTNHVRLFPRAEDILDDVAAGRSAIGYNIVGSYALEQIGRYPYLGMVLPRDYTLLMSRLAVIPGAAAHPAAAKLFLDYLLSREGQEHLVAVEMPSVRADVASPPALTSKEARLRAIRVGPGLLVDQDKLTRRYVNERWAKALEGTEK